MIKGVIFDMDGLLFDTERVYRESWEVLAPQFHITHNPEFPGAVAGTNGQSMINCVNKYYPEIDAEAFIAAAYERVASETKKHLRKMPGTDEILAFLKEHGIKIAVASGSTLEQVKSNLESANVLEYFDAVTSSEEVENGKPAPDVFLLAAKRLGVKPEECYVFEDGINGMYAGFAAGCKSIMIPDFMQPTEEIKEKAYGIYPSLLEAIKHLEV